MYNKVLVRNQMFFKSWKSLGAILSLTWKELKQVSESSQEFFIQIYPINFLTYYSEPFCAFRIPFVCALQFPTHATPPGFRLFQQKSESNRRYRAAKRAAVNRAENYA